jgi:hypothetical protein
MDALSAHQRPKIERYHETTVVVVKSIGYDDDREWDRMNHWWSSSLAT